jgi:phosphatidylglycerophosphate synthase
MEAGPTVAKEAIVTQPAPAAAGRPREIWTRFMVDPLATPLAAWLARSSHVTPNRVTAVAIACAVGAATCFAFGQLRVGGVLFLLRFFVDCMDGKVARAQGTSSARGALLDIAADVGGIALVTASLSWTLLRRDDVHELVPVALLGAMLFYNWALAYRKQLAGALGLGEGGADHTKQFGIPVVRQWVAFCRRLNMSPVPWALEAEIMMLGLAPLFLPSVWVGSGLMVGLCFYLLADAVNVRRLWRFARMTDERRKGVGTV